MLVKQIITQAVKAYPDLTPLLKGRAARIAWKSQNAPDDAERIKMERRIEKLMKDYLDGRLAELMGFLENDRTPPPDFWQMAEASLYETLLPPMREAASNGVTNALDANTFFGVSWDIVNMDAIAWAEKNTAEVVRSISKTQMQTFQQEFGAWVESGEPLKELIKKLEPIYGDVKAGQVAVTETTRAYAAGNLAVWKNSGVVSQFNVFTAEDDIVCPICTGQEASNPHNINAEHPPFHVNCRCWVQPVVKGYE